MTKRNRLFTLAVICLILGGCAAKTTTIGTPPVPNPPEVTVLQYAQVAQAAGLTASSLLVSLCVVNPPQTPPLDLVTCNKVKNGLLTVKSAVDQIVVEANKVPGIETWAQARINIAAIIATATVNAATGNTALDQDIAAVAAAVKLIQGVQ